MTFADMKGIRLDILPSFSALLRELRGLGPKEKVRNSARAAANLAEFSAFEVAGMGHPELAARFIMHASMLERLAHEADDAA